VAQEVQAKEKIMTAKETFEKLFATLKGAQQELSGSGQATGECWGPVGTSFGKLRRSARQKKERQLAHFQDQHTRKKEVS
jgi:hypothetical protein